MRRRGPRDWDRQGSDATIKYTPDIYGQSFGSGVCEPRAGGAALPAVEHHFVSLSSFQMSSALHAVVRGPSFTLEGKRPSRTPFHQVDFDTGKTARTWGRRTNPVAGSPALSLSMVCWITLGI